MLPNRAVADGRSVGTATCGGEARGASNSPSAEEPGDHARRRPLAFGEAHECLSPAPTRMRPRPVPYRPRLLSGPIVEMRLDRRRRATSDRDERRSPRSTAPRTHASDMRALRRRGVRQRDRWPTWNPTCRSDVISRAWRSRRAGGDQRAGNPAALAIVGSNAEAAGLPAVRGESVAGGNECSR